METPGAILTNNEIFMDKVRQLERGEASWEPEEADCLRDALAMIEGAQLDYNLMDGEGYTLFGQVVVTFEDELRSWELLERMIHHGLNPLASSKPEQLAEQALVFEHPSLLLKMERCLAELDEPDFPAYRSEAGGNLYHALAALTPGRMAVHMEMLRYTPEPHPALLLWITEANDNGDTPLHVLWGSKTDLPRKFGEQWSQDFPEHLDMQIPFINVLSVRATTDMLALGADLLTPNHKGHTAFDFMMRRDMAHLEDEQAAELAQEIIASTQGRILERDTPSPPKANKAPVRL